jgi:hypothetical protein
MHNYKPFNKFDKELNLIELFNNLFTSIGTQLSSFNGLLSSIFFFSHSFV